MICRALRAEIARVGWSETARLCGVDRSSLHRAFPKDATRRIPHFLTVSLVANALGFKIDMAVRPPATAADPEWREELASAGHPRSAISILGRQIDMTDLGEVTDALYWIEDSLLGLMRRDRAAA